MSPLASELLAILACPVCKGPVSVRSPEEGGGIVCPACRLRYPVRDDVAILLADDAERVDSSP